MGFLSSSSALGIGKFHLNLNANILIEIIIAIAIIIAKISGILSYVKAKKEDAIITGIK